MRLILSVLLLVLGSAAVAQTGGTAERTPFTEIRFDSENPTICVNGTWYVWLAIDDISYDDLAEFALEIAQDRWRERIGEDLVWIMSEYGQAPGESVDLLVEPIGGGDAILLSDTPMTNENRSIALETTEDNVELNRLLQARRARDGDFDRKASLRELSRVVRVVHSYASLIDVDLNALIEGELDRLGNDAGRGEMMLAAQRIVCRLGDGHASVLGWRDGAPSGYLPALLEYASGGVVAYKPDRSGFLDDERPYVTEIDGLPVEQWIESASSYVTDGSEQLVRRRSLQLLRWINLIRDEMDRPHDGHVSFTLSDGRGDDETSTRIAAADQRPIYGTWPRGETRVLDSGIGYLRLASMQPSRELAVKLMRDGRGRSELDAIWIDGIHAELDSLASCPGLIIDVRGNGGGGREPTIALMQRLMASSSLPVVVNAARARISRAGIPSDPEGYLDNRYLYPANWDGWSSDERDAIAEFRANFKPAWSPSHGRFSDWHFMVVSPNDQSPASPRPVVVLIDDGCFSATDIFAAAMGELPNVTLLGQPTSGGSARSKTFDLEHLGAEVRLGSMVSYQPSGQLYDGVGVMPDVSAERLPTDLIGETDSVLELAEKMLLEQ